MAIYHLSMKAIERSKGRSATAAAAYRAGCLIEDGRTGEVHDYRRKSDVLHSALILPGGQVRDRSEFWSSVELHHKRGDAVTAREIEISLPSELDESARKSLALDFAKSLAVRYGVAADISIHAPRLLSSAEVARLKEGPKFFDEQGRPTNGNHHAHILLTACQVDQEGTLGKKAVRLDPIHCKRAGLPSLADQERPGWEAALNGALSEHTQDPALKVSHKSYKARGLDGLPGLHLGPKAAAYERRTGVKSLRRQAHEAPQKEHRLLIQRMDKTLRKILDLDAQIEGLKGRYHRYLTPQRDRLGSTTEAIERGRGIERIPTRGPDRSGPER